MVSIPGLSRKSEDKSAPKKSILEQLEGADVDALIVKTETEISEAEAAIERIQERVRKLEGARNTSRASANCKARRKRSRRRELTRSPQGEPAVPDLLALSSESYEDAARDGPPVDPSPRILDKKFYAEESAKGRPTSWTAVDNCGGEFFTEEFESEANAIAWLNDPEQRTGDD